MKFIEKDLRGISFNLLFYSFAILCQRKFLTRKKGQQTTASENEFEINLKKVSSFFYIMNTILND